MQHQGRSERRSETPGEVEAGQDTATIVAVSHDNTDDGVIPFSQITVRVHDSQENVRLSGPEIKFYLTGVT